MNDDREMAIDATRVRALHKLAQHTGDAEALIACRTVIDWIEAKPRAGLRPRLAVRRVQLFARRMQVFL